MGNGLSIGAFTPETDATLSVSSTTLSVHLPAGATNTIRNSGSADAYYAIGGVGVEATTSSHLIKAGEIHTISPGNCTHIAAITASSTTTLLLVGGSGLPLVSQAGGSGGGGTVGGATEAKQDALAVLVGEVQASPTANTVLARLKSILTGVVLATGSNVIGKVGVQVGGSDVAAANPVPMVEGNSAAPITGASMPAGGVGLTGWLSAIWIRLASVVVTFATATRTSRSGTITTGGQAQPLMAANSSRKGWCLQNNNTSGNIWFDETGATAVATQPSIELYPGDFYESPSAGATPTAISIIGDTTGMTFSAREW